MNRRDFIDNGYRLALGLPLITSPILGSLLTAEDFKSTPKMSPLKILILGGTSFLGPHQVAYALSRGHQVTTFTRGKTQPSIHQELFKEVESLTGDRENNLTALENRRWDVVIDNSGRDTQWTEDTANLLKENCELYLYTSSTGVYYPYLKADRNEGHDVLLEEPEEITDEETKIEYWYGVMKANSELSAKKYFGINRTIIVRPTYMIGPADKTNRFIHWPLRLSQPGEVLVPGVKSDPVQYVDVRDVAEWMIRLIESKVTGTFNAVGPRLKQGIFDFVNEAQQAFKAEHELVSVDDYSFLKSQGLYYIVPWIMPEGNNWGSARINNEKALANGLTFRSLKDSVRDTYEWWYSDGVSDEQRNKLLEDTKTALYKEQAILEAWKNR